MSFGQLVIGPPGSGKTTYCTGMQQFLQSLGRKVSIVNLDPANDALPYKAAVDISELITLENTLNDLELGPNGGKSDMKSSSLMPKASCIVWKCLNRICFHGYMTS